jgi:hypothetical protein
MATSRPPLSGGNKNNPLPLSLPKTPYVHHKSINGMPQINNIKTNTTDGICNMFILIEDQNYHIVYIGKFNVATMSIVEIIASSNSL